MSTADEAHEARRAARPRWLLDAERIDLALYAAIAATDTPSLDRAMHSLSRAANFSKVWLGAAGAVAALRGERGRRAAAEGLIALGITSAVVNQGVKRVARRRRPDRLAHEVPVARHVPMPTTRSLPSGHSASAFAFATAVGHVLPHEAAALRLLAAVVAYSRVHTGVHFPGDVVVGSLIGTAIGQATGSALQKRRER